MGEKISSMIAKLKFSLFCLIVEAFIIVCVALANVEPTPIRYFLFYDLLYGVGLSFLLPLYWMGKKNEGAASVGIKKLGARQMIVLMAFAVFSVGGQLIPAVAAGEQLPWHLLPMGIVPLIMTTFFEEFLFRGYMQTRLEKRYGWLPAILISGSMFSLYHLGYPGFRNFADILLLFAVGVGFSCAYKLSDNNLIVVYFVNLPNAFVTYVVKFDQFPVMDISSTIAASVTIVMIVSILWMDRKKLFRERA